MSKVLDHLVSGQTPAPTAAVVTAASSTASRPAPSSDSGCLPLEQAASLLGTDFLWQVRHHCSLPNQTLHQAQESSISDNHISGHAASAIHTGFLQANQDLQDHTQTLAFQGHTTDASMTYSPWQLLLSDLLPMVFHWGWVHWASL